MVGYPIKKKSHNNDISISNHASRGMCLEQDLNDSNTYYREIKRALIYKKPTPIQVVRVEYPARSAAKISEAYFKIPSTTDYQGIYRSKAIDFEAKQTNSKTSFPFSSIHAHQIKHLEEVIYHGGIGFVIIKFTFYQETYMLPAQHLLAYIQNKKRSFPYHDVQIKGILIKTSLNPRLCYLDAVDNYFFKEETK